MVTKTETTLAASFGVPPEPHTEVIQYVQQPIVTTQESDDAFDFDEVSDNLEKLLVVGNDAIENLAEIASVEESPRAFEALNTLIGNMANINMQLIEVQERKAKLKTAKTSNTESGSTTNQTVNNNMVFVGTTQELQQLIRQRMKDSQ